ncbi:MAG: PIN domain-containing protein [Acidobacteria bacterium]|nr:PIN domain-containing protein [Acidobacteriota bacterium]
MIVVDTGAMVALLDASEDHHTALKDLFEESPDSWILPWAILPEVDYLVTTHLGLKAHETFLADLADGAFTVEWGRDEDLVAARRIHTRYRSLRLGLVDAVVIATAERLAADAIATLDLRHFSAVAIKGNPRLLPRDR